MGAPSARGKEMESHSEIEQRAAVWLSRRGEPDWTAADQDELDAWLEASTAHKVAFVRLDAGWERTRRLKALGAGGEVGVVPPPGQWHTNAEFAPERADRWWQRAKLRPALAATVVLALVATGMWRFAWNRGPTYTTPVGVTASVPMKDGSNVTLNTDSAIRVALSDTQREVRLEHGEAFFDVARDQSRPFVVTAGDKRVVAVGTKFSVRRIDDEVRVFVTEGQVRIENSFVAAGSIARARDDSILVRADALPEVENYLSWRSGYLVFADTPLADAVAEFNRYNERKIVVADAEVAAVRIGGKFRATNVDVFVRLLTEGYDIDAQSTDGRIVVRERHAR